MTNPLAPIAKLRDSVAIEARKVGLILQQLSAIPGVDSEGPHRSQMVFIVDESWVPTTVESTSDPEFDRIMREAELAEKDRIADEAKKGLTSLMEDLKDPKGGIGLDD